MNAQIQIGQKVHCILYGGRDGIVYNIRGEQKPDTCKTMGGFISHGGNAQFDIAWDNGTLSNGTPECIIHGVQWRLFEDIATPEEIIAALEHAQRETARKQEEAKQAAIQRDLDRDAMRTLYPYLTEAPGRGGKEAAKNARIELKRQWPKIKFSVTSEYDKTSVSWTDGPTEKQVEEIVNKYQAGHFDGMTDCYEYSYSAFNDVFGSVRYVQTRRETSAELFDRAFAMVKSHYSGNIAADLVCTHEDYRQGRLWNVSMNTGGHAHRDNIQSYINGVLSNLPATGCEYKHKITQNDGKFQMHYYSYNDGRWCDREELTLEDCLDRLSWEFWKYC